MVVHPVSADVYAESLDSDLDLRPFLWPLPSELNRYRDVFLKFNGKKFHPKQTNDALSLVLTKLKDKHNGHIALTENEVEHDLNACLSILDCLWKRDADTKTISIFVPIDNPEPLRRLVLKRPTECVYSGTDWLSRAYRDNKSYVYVHSKITEEIAKFFGVESLKQKISDSKDMMPQREFGQTEELTARLKSLLKEGYTDGFSVPKELVQNADDAGASKVAFLFDERENTNFTENLIDEKMSECQGPAFWAYNNALFAEQDFTNIQKLSGATKRDDTSKIGQFGLGFNAVYNLTDVPSFVSGNQIAFFDPHRRFLADAIRSDKSTEILLDLRNQTMVENFRNQFAPYEHNFGFRSKATDRKHVFEGTLFRFPLRTKDQARDSDICNVHYTKNGMKGFLNLFHSSAGNLLLFTQHVQEISLYNLSSEGKFPDEDKELVFKVSKQAVFQSVFGPGNVLTAASRVVEKHSFKNREDATCFSRSTITSIYGPAAPKLLSKVDMNSGCKCDWLVSWSVGRKKSLEMFKRNESDGSLPFASVALPIVEGRNLRLEAVPEGFYKVAHVFVYLPLPVITHLPVHVNGGFAVSADRRRLLTSSSDDKSESRHAKWNKALLEDAVLNSYVKLLEYVRDNGLLESHDVISLWPVHTDLDDTLSPLIDSFYKAIVEDTSIKLFFCERSNISQWKAFKDCTFLDETLASNPEVGHIALTMMKHLSETVGIWFTEMPSRIRLSFLRACQEKKLKKREWTIKKFYSAFLKNIDTNFLDRKEKEKLLVYALKRNDKDIEEIIIKTKCISTNPRGHLKLPSELVDPKSVWISLFTDDDEVFPCNIFCESEIVETLQRLGMMSSEIPWNILVLQAKKTKDVAMKCVVCAHTRAGTILTFLQEMQKKGQGCPLEILEKLKHEQFIPAREKPKDWTLPWKAEDVCKHNDVGPVCTKHNQSNVGRYGQVFVMPKDLYLENTKDLTGCSELVIPQMLRNYETQLRKLGVKEKKDIPLSNLKFQLQCLNEGIISSAILLRVSEAVFTFFQSRLHDSVIKDFLENQLKEDNCILIGQELVKPSQTCLHLKHECKPYLYGLNDSPLVAFKEVFQKMGVKTKFDEVDVTRVLQSLKAKYGDCRMSEDELELACRVSLLLEDLDVPSVNNLVLPDQKGFLLDSTELCLDDCPWIPETSSMNFLHKSIPPKVAEMAGIQSKRKHDITVDSSEFGIEFGQHEDLTNRIKRILDGYPNINIMKELLQNADDAGATELHFIKDNRHHSTDRVFSESWKTLQGPALCVYNDSVFEEKDLEGIQNLGVGSKGDDPTATGQYGVGFNVVYHLTDVPSFISKCPGDSKTATLCVLDPHCQYIPGATITRPGRRFQNLDHTRRKYPDVFTPYLEDIAVWKNDGGTMFRFPLRNEYTTSEIVQDHIDQETLDDLIKDFKNEMKHSLMFLHNVRRIIVSRIDYEGILHTEHFIDAKVSKTYPENGVDIYQAIKDTRKQAEGDRTLLINLPRLETKYHLTLTANGLDSSKEEWLVFQSIGFA